MSKIADSIRDNDLQFVIPYASKMFYSYISKDDKALCFMLNKGFIESKSLEVCYAFSLFLDNTLGDSFTIVGKIDKVRLTNDTIVYRQRVLFTSLSLLLPILSNFNVVLTIPKTFKIGISQMSRCFDSIPSLESYMEFKSSAKYTLDTWLTDCCLIQLLIFCNIEKVEFNSYRSINDILIPGLLDRAPYVCGSFDSKLHKSSVLIPPREYLVIKNTLGVDIDILTNSLELQHDTLSKNYSILYKNESIPIYGFTTRNIKQDISQKGGISNGSKGN